MVFALVKIRIKTFAEFWTKFLTRLSFALSKLQLSVWRRSVNELMPILRVELLDSHLTNTICNCVICQQFLYFYHLCRSYTCSFCIFFIGLLLFPAIFQTAKHLFLILKGLKRRSKGTGDCVVLPARYLTCSTMHHRSGHRGKLISRTRVPKHAFIF